MAKQKRVWVVVSDGRRARCLSLDELGQLSPVPEGTYDNATLGRHERDLVSDKPGRSFASGPGARRGAIEPHHDYRKLEKHRFSANLAAFLDRACEQDRFDRCLMVAPPRSLGELRTLVSDRLKTRIWKEIAKDLAARSPAEIASALATDLRRAATAL